jgi:SAM-dependent MidA family methyltransferase
MSALPPPDPDQLAASARLSERILARIDSAGGWIGFDTWMAMALYEPDLGYYAGGSRKFGAAGDFVTAPELSPLFGRSIAAQLAQWFAQGVPTRVYEFGAGTGALAATILAALAEDAGPGPVNSRFEYRIVELSAELRARQRETIAERAAELLDRVEWLGELPERIEGVVLGNELLDAMPVRLFRLVGDEVLERGVVRAQTRAGESAGMDASASRTGSSARPGLGVSGSHLAAPGAVAAGSAATRSADPGSPGSGTVSTVFAFGDRPADPAFEQAVRAALRRSNWAALGGWPDGYTSELGEQASAWVATVANRLVHGALLLIDYGFPSAEFYHPQRAQGTLMCHYRHHSHDDSLWLPGAQDITAHVDFSAVAQAAEGAGLALLGYSSQSAFLIGCGLPELAMQAPRGNAIDWARQASALQRLLSEAEMGELFKAVAFGRGLPDDALGFARSDRRAVLQVEAGR